MSLSWGEAVFPLDIVVILYTAQIPIKPVDVKLSIFLGIPESLPSVPLSLLHNKMYERRTDLLSTFNKNLRLLNGHELIRISMDNQCRRQMGSDKIDRRDLMS